MRYYAANNDYTFDADSLVGFAHTWYVLAFATKRARDQYVLQAPGLSAHAITRKEVPKYVARTPTPFTDERYALIMPIQDEIPGFLGTIEVAHKNAPYVEADL